MGGYRASGIIGIKTERVGVHRMKIDMMSMLAKPKDEPVGNRTSKRRYQ
jgi:hypothetical protein